MVLFGPTATLNASRWEPSWEPSAVDCGGRVWTLADTKPSPFQAMWTSVDSYGRRLDIYGSGGWVFESPRARC